MLKKYTVLNFRNVFIVTISQLFLLLLSLFLVYYKFGYYVAFSGFLGGVTSVLSFFLFFIVFFFNNKNYSPKFIVRKFYLAGLLKVVLLILIFSIFFKIGIYNPLCFFIFLFFIQFSFWLMCFLFFMEI